MSADYLSGPEDLLVILLTEVRLLTTNARGLSVYTPALEEDALSWQRGRWRWRTHRSGRRRHVIWDWDKEDTYRPRRSCRHTACVARREVIESTSIFGKTDNPQIQHTRLGLALYKTRNITSCFCCLKVNTVMIIPQRRATTN